MDVPSLSPVKLRPLGRTGLTVSDVALGTWAFASQVYGTVSERQAAGTVAAALDLGINLFDTAPLYGSAQQDGIAEEILGRALRGRRSEVVVATKFGRTSTDIGPHFDARHARISVEASLRRLGTAHIDVLFFHSPFSPEEICDDVWEELQSLRQEGKIRFIGHSVSMFQATSAMCGQWACEGRIDVVQLVYSLMNREAEELIAKLAALGVGVVARESLANGFLTGTVRRDTVFGPDNLNSRYSREEIAERVGYVERLAELLVRDDVATLPQAALRFVLDNPGVSTVLSGAKTPAEIRDAAAASTARPFSAEEHQTLRELHTRDFAAA